MDLKVVFVGVCLCAFAVTYSQAGIPNCCVATKRFIPLNILFKVQRWEAQSSSGACDIPALILYVKDLRNPICANPKVKMALMKILQRRKRMPQKHN